MNEKIKQMPLDERIEKLFESGWVNEFNYLENQLQEARCLVSILQKELDQYKNNWEELKKCINHYAIDEEDGSKIYSVEEIELLEILDKMKELEENN